MEETERKHDIPMSLFEQVAKAVVPGLRESVKEMFEGTGVTADDVSPMVGVTSNVMINGHNERVRITVELNPDESESDEDDEDDGDEDSE